MSSSVWDWGPGVSEALVLTVGFGGQFLFSLRFLLQWLASERAGRSVMPQVFWHMSLAGGAALLVYALLRADPVFIVGQGLGLLVYGRNLWLIRRERQSQSTAAEGTPACAAPGAALEAAEAPESPAVAAR